jgi:hypothetical protein
MPLNHQRLHLLDGLQCVASWSIGILLRLQVGLENGLQDHQHRHLHDTILDRWNAQRSLLAVRFGNVDPPDRLRTIRLLAELIRQLIQPLLLSVLLDVLEGLAVHTCRAVIEVTVAVGVPQHIRSVHLVVQRIEAVRGCALRFGMQRLL